MRSTGAPKRWRRSLSGRSDGGRLGRPILGVVVLGCSAAALACGGAAETMRPAQARRAPAATALSDPTVRPGRVVPEAVAEERTYGVEPGGGVRFLVSGVRTVGLPGGRVLAARDRLPQAPSQVTALPDRLGGGFLFVVGTTVWHAPRWLDPAKPVFVAPQPVARVVVGLDRVYLRNGSGAHLAIDPRTGALRDAGPLPGTPHLGGFAAADGWRAVAIADLRGAVATFDAGTTWRPLPLPIEPREVVAVGEGLYVSGLDASKQTLTYELRGEGQLTRVPGPPPRATFAEAASLALADPTLRMLGKRPLQAAIEDGWPLSDGSALVARDGILARVGLSDGALLDVVRDAYPLRPSRCHAVPLGPGLGGQSRIGFVCGEPRGRTIVYKIDETLAGLKELRKFEAPRAITSSGNGALVVSGPCSEGAPSKKTGERTFCLLPRDGSEREVIVRNATGGERLVVLGDGRVVIVSPPEGDLARARLTILDAKGTQRTLPLAFEGASPELARLLRGGTWLEGFEERRPGTLGGWVEGSGTVLGVEIDLEGTARAGALVRDLGHPVVSSRYGIGWTAARRAYETTDGGMTWTTLEVPEPVHSTFTSAVRACGPAGATIGGWIRVGWGATPPPSYEAPPAPRFPIRPGASLELDCEPVGAPPKPPPEAPPVTFVRPPSPRFPMVPLLAPPGAPPQGRVELPPFYATGAPVLTADETGLSTETAEPLDRSARSGPLARLYTWGPRLDDWDKRARWLARWVPPFASSVDVRSTVPAPAAFATLDGARRFFGQGPVAPVSWSLASSEDGSQALLVGRRSGGGESAVLLLEAERPLVEVTRADREPFADLDAATRVGGRWYLVGSQSAGEAPASVVYVVEGGLARELVRLPRAGLEGRPTPVRLARRSDGRAVGLVVDGQPSPERSPARRWIVPVDVDSGVAGEPELLGYSDLADHPSLTACTGDESAWVLDATFLGSVRVTTSGQGLGLLQNTVARLRFGRTGVCVSALSGSLEGVATMPPRGRPAPRGTEPIVLAATGSRVKRLLHCALRGQD